MNDEQDDSPVSAGDPAPKKGAKNKKGKAAKKAATKKAAKAKSAGASTNGVGRSKFADDMAISVKKTAHEFTGKRGEALDALLKAKTVGGFRETLKKKESAGNDRMSTYSGWAIKTALDEGLATVK